MEGTVGCRCGMAYTEGKCSHNTQTDTAASGEGRGEVRRGRGAGGQSTRPSLLFDYQMRSKGVGETFYGPYYSTTCRLLLTLAYTLLHVHMSGVLPRSRTRARTAYCVLRCENND